MTRNYQDRIGYGGVPFDEANPFIAGLVGGLVVVLGAFVGGVL